MEKIGSQDNFIRLINQYQNLIFSICLKLTGDYFAAEDLTQETFLSAFKYIDSFDGQSEKAWICRIASNKAIDYLKSAKRREVPGFGNEENEEIFINDADSRADAEYLGELIKKKMPSVKKIRYGDIGAVIGAHAGPGTVALFYLAKDRTIVEV